MLMEGDWNNEFVIVEPDGRVEYSMFAPDKPATAPGKVEAE